MRAIFITGLLLAAVALFALAPMGVRAQQDAVGTPVPAAEQNASDFRVPKPDLQDLEQIRFVTENDYPPFNYIDEDGDLTGFNVDLARFVCDELSVECSVRAESWGQLITSLKQGDADAIIASMRVSEEALRELDFTDAYYHTPARFVALKGREQVIVTPEALAGVKLGVVAGSAHEAYLKDFFVESEIVSFKTSEEAKVALRGGSIDLIFGDGVSLMFWINGTLSEDCCEFRGGPFTESRYFGEGIGIAVLKGNRKLREALNYGLHLVRSEGRFEELHLRYFPLSFF